MTTIMKILIQKTIPSQETAITFANQPIIDILHKDPRNHFDPNNETSLDVVILGLNEFDVNTIDPGTIKIGNVIAKGVYGINSYRKNKRRQRI